MTTISRVTGWIERFRKSTLLRRMGALTTGTVIAQAIQLLNLVVLAKFYPLSDVGIYSVFFAVVGTLTPVAMLGYEMLIPAVPDAEVRPYLKSVVLLPIPMALLIAVTALLLGYDHWAAIAPWIAGAAIQRLGEMYNVRRNRFGRVAAARLLPALLMSGVLASLIVSRRGDINAMIAWQAGLVFLLGISYTSFSLPLRELTASDRWRDMVKTLRNAANAPLFLMPSNVLNLIAYNVPVVVIGKWFSPDLAAQYAYVLRFGFGPVSLIGGTLYQVFYGLLTEAVRDQNEVLFQQFARARRVIFFAALAATLGIAFTYPIGFQLLLGPQWIIAGWISVIFAPFFGAMIYLTPLSVSLNTFNRQYYDLKTQIHYLAISIFSFGTAIAVHNSWIGFMLFSWLGCLRYAILLRYINVILIENKVIPDGGGKAA
ncbi:lipopolysaccharide biosynthesis protein [Pararhizobium sp.]|uniref:lipopolysaccharide biosynthesis protein n=1 Tax=Pararhizobium sp. TaxID=1977563 RepID=UPI00271D2AF0|nr:oligosaccharide flippase family protein [Pararhizobium sp.]MDO9418347.1 oligosaccharide flippase family protein [Pararhizobium sp.]